MVPAKHDANACGNTQEQKPLGTCCSKVSADVVSVLPHVDVVSWYNMQDYIDIVLAHAVDMVQGKLPIKALGNWMPSVVVSLERPWLRP